MGIHDFSRYAELLSRIDTFGSMLRKRHGSDISCAPGCDACCGQVLELLAVEYYYLQTAAQQLRPAEQPSAGAACPLLYRGRCLAYQYRPVICRTHGLPLLIEEGGRQWVDCCPGNFKSVALKDIPGESLLHLERLNLLLVSINHVFCAARGIDAAKRISLACICNDQTKTA